ncbi:hypothetical protein [Actinacidiphila yeochonensis]|uniref:hypothetical protein n=1 Tax=Actinacidiphila yeochonensis TaxID=89050 RepID=UPI00055F5E12|nr:hypothetical protein [Actinacidiphila yeochonensis]
MLRFDHLALLVRVHLADVRSRARQDAGYTTETIVITALLAILAMTVVGIIVAKVTAKAHGISLG